MQKLRMLSIICVLVLFITALPFAASATQIPDGLKLPYKQGASSKSILAIKERMQELGYYKAGATMNKDFNATMTERVMQFQKNNGLEETGIVDQEFIEKLYSDTAIPADQTAAAATPAPVRTEVPTTVAPQQTTSAPAATPAPVVTQTPVVTEKVTASTRFVKLTATPRPAGPTPKANTKAYSILYEMENRARYVDGTFYTKKTYYNQ